MFSCFVVGLGCLAAPASRLGFQEERGVAPPGPNTANTGLNGRAGVNQPRLELCPGLSLVRKNAR